MSNSSHCMVMASATSMPAVFSVLAHCVHMCSPSKSQSKVRHEGLPGPGCIVTGSNNHCHWQIDVQKATARRDHADLGCAQWPIVSMRWVSVHVAPYVLPGLLTCSAHTVQSLRHCGQQHACMQSIQDTAQQHQLTVWQVMPEEPVLPCGDETICARAKWLRHLFVVPCTLFRIQAPHTLCPLAGTGRPTDTLIHHDSNA